MRTQTYIPIALACALSLGCQKVKKTEHDAMGDFARSVLIAGKAKDADTFINKLSMNSLADLNAMVAVLKKADPTFKAEEDGEKQPADAEILEQTKANVHLFMNSYADIFEGEGTLSSIATAQDTRIKGANIYAMIIWAKHRDGKYRGILIDTVWKSDDGPFKVITWTQLSGYEAHKNAQKKKAILVRDTAASCNFPETMTYECFYSKYDASDRY